MRVNLNRKSPAQSHSTRAAIVVELVVALPVLAVFIAATIEFGAILSGMTQVAMASRMGAQIAAEDSNLQTVAGSTAAVTAIQARVDRVLATAGIGSASAVGNSCTVQLRHNIRDGSGLYTAGGSCPCESPTSNLPPTPPIAAVPSTPFYVRVTVCVELGKLAPPLLNSFGFSTANRFVEHTATYPYEPLVTALP
jgi:Flp pilus assembly protein TadG